jgi:hypothetical protein
LAPLQIVQSRTFGSAAREGGVGVRMLVPLADLLNHGGDEAAFLLHHKPTQTDNVRYVDTNAFLHPSFLTYIFDNLTCVTVIQ